MVRSALVREELERIRGGVDDRIIHGPPESEEKALLEGIMFELRYMNDRLDWTNT